jgi:hypothetical protein
MVAVYEMGKQAGMSEGASIRGSEAAETSRSLGHGLTNRSNMLSPQRRQNSPMSARDARPLFPSPLRERFSSGSMGRVSGSQGQISGSEHPGVNHGDHLAAAAFGSPRPGSNRATQKWVQELDTSPLPLETNEVG